MPASSSAEKSYRRLGLALFTMTAVYLSASLLFSAVAGVLSRMGVFSLESPWVSWPLRFLPLYLLGFPAALLMLHGLPTPPIQKSKLRGKDFFSLFLMCFPILYGGSLLGSLLSSLLSGGTAQNGLTSLAMSTHPLKILFMVLLAPMLEELVFRKLLIDKCSRYGEKTAVLFSALCFGLFHMNLFQFFYAFGLGLLLGFTYLRTRRLRYSVLMHMGINLMGSVLAPAVLSLIDADAMAQMSSGVVDEATALAAAPGILLLFLYALVVLGLSIAGLVLLISKARKLLFFPAPEELPRGQRFRTVYLNVGFALFFLLCLGMSIFSLFA